MLDELNKRLEEIQKQVVEQDLKGRRIRDMESDLQIQRERVEDLALLLVSEEADVDELEGLSIRGMFLSVFGDKEQELDKEKSEYFAAWLKHDQALETAKYTSVEIESLRKKRKALGDLRAQKATLLKEKEQFLIAANDHYSEVLLALAQERGTLMAERNELGEALREGFLLQEGLDEIIRDLRKARGWGAFDLLGGGLIVTAVKHSNIDDARARIAGVQMQLNRFRREMSDVNMETEIVIVIGNFTTFADYFFDGLIFDWVVQSQISKSLSQVEQTRRAVTLCLSQLSAQHENNKTRDIEIVHERRTIIEKA